MTEQKHKVPFHRIYKYQVDERTSFFTQVTGYDVEVDGGWVYLQTDGRITFKQGYCWDGCTVVPDAPGTEAPSLVHDGLYQLTREGHLPKSLVRKLSDKTFHQMMQENQVSPFICWLYYRGVRALGWAFC